MKIHERNLIKGINEYNSIPIIAIRHIQYMGQADIEDDNKQCITCVQQREAHLINVDGIH